MSINIMNLNIGIYRAVLKSFLLKIFKFFLAIFLFGAFFSSALAVETEAEQEQEQEQESAVTEEEVGETKTFVVSAYYSPLPGQEAYVRGNYEAEKQLQGEGVRGADYTKVYVGMIAAPKSYDFGTKIFIPGLGVGTVHDRGGAILAYDDFDRIDVWMGYGDDGRKRALEWGMRKVEGRVMPADTAETMNFEILPKSTEMFSFDKNPQSSQSSQKSNTVKKEKEAVKKTSTTALSKGDRGERVKNLQNFLAKEGFFEGVATGFYGERTTASVLKFQKFHGIVKNDTDLGAGVYGKQTQKKVKELWDTDKEMRKYAVDVDFIPVGMGVGDKGKEVRRLQMVLKELGYFHETPTGNYGPKTQASVLSFQKEKKIVSSTLDLGAGYFGPQTERMLSLELLERRKRVKSSISFQTLKIDKKMLADIKKGNAVQKKNILKEEVKKVSSL